MRRFAPIVVVVIIGQVLAACSSRGLGPGEARLTLSGRAQVARPGQGWQEAHSGRTLHRGERLKVQAGLAQVHLSNDRVVELRKESEIELQNAPMLLKGDALATAKDVGLSIDAGAAAARVRKGAAHVTRGLATEAASYAGDVTLESAGRELTVPALRQAAVPGPGLVPATPTPLDYRADNPWDRRFLGDAIELGDELQARSQGFTAQLAPTEGHTAGFYRQLLPDLDSERAFDQALIDPNASPGDTLVGAAIAIESRRGSFTDRWQGVFGFRAQGARWGLVALDQKVIRAPLLSTVDAALGRLGGGGAGGGGVAAGPPGGGPLGGLTGPPAEPGAPSVSGPGQASGGGGATGGGGGGAPTTTLLPPAPTPPPGLLPPLLPGPGNGGGGPTTTTTPPGPVGGLVQGVGNAVGGLLGGLLGRH